MSQDRLLLSGDEAVALAALHAGVSLGTGYPGTPSTEILEAFSQRGGRAQWSPNEKVALEVALGSSYAGAATLVTMKHVGVNVAADPLFTAAYTGVSGALVLVSADDPGMASSQNEQDNRRYAEAAGLPMLEPADSQEAYDFTLAALEISHRWQCPVMLRITTRVCHSKTIVQPRLGVAAVRQAHGPEQGRRANAAATAPVPPASAGGFPTTPTFHRDIKSRVMIPAYAKLAHRRLRKKLAEMQEWNETSDLNKVIEPHGEPSPKFGIIASGISYMHAREAAPSASILKLGMTYPLPLRRIAEFVKSVDRCVVIEEGDPYLVNAISAAGLAVEGKDEMYRFGELDVRRVRRIIDKDNTPEAAPSPGKPPQLCVGCPHRKVFEALSRLDCIVSGDIGCYTLGVLPPFERMDTCVCMGASIGVGLGMRHVLGDGQARHVVSVIGDSTFVHSGLTGLVEMVYNPPATGHLVIVLDNATTAMTGLQEHPGTGRKLDHSQTNQLVIEDVIRAMGIDVQVIDPMKDDASLDQSIDSALAGNKLNVIIAHRPCLLATAKIKQYEAKA